MMLQIVLVVVKDIVVTLLEFHGCGYIGKRKCTMAISARSVASAKMILVKFLRGSEGI